MSTQRDQNSLHKALIPVIALIAIFPLILHGCSCGHDFSFHLMSWFDAARQFRHGDLHPQWAFSPAYNAGEPRFVFYPPLSWSLGASIGLLLRTLPGITENAAWNAAPVVYTWLVLTLSGWTMYRLARHFASSGAALIAVALYMTNPYMLFTAYERTAFAELLAAAWLPLLVHAVIRPRPSLRGIAIPLALLWLTNAPAAVIGSYSLALLALLRLIASSLAAVRRHRASELRVRAAQPRQRVPIRLFASEGVIPYLRPRLHFALTVLAGTGLGLLLAAFYIVPAAYERQYVQIAMAVIPHLRVQDNFIFHHFIGPEAVFHNQVLHTASTIAVLLEAVAAVLLGANYHLSRIPEGTTNAAAVPVRAFAVLLGVICFLLTPWSLPIWNQAPEAAFLQFPWRALSIVGILVSVAAAGVLTRVQWKPFAGSAVALIAGILLVLPASGIFRQGCDATVAPSALLSAFESSHGTDPTDEYTPVTADNDALAQSNPPYWLADTPEAAPPAGATSGPAPASLELRLPHPADLILNLRAYPAWTVILDGEPDLQRLNRDDGLIALPLPAGVSIMNLQYTRLPDQKLGEIFSLVGLGLLVASALPPRWRSHVRFQPASATSGAKALVSEE